MKKLTFEEVKQVALEILIYFHKFCEENNLTYYLAYGTLLGAVRHKGFIPWDDDIDVYMPRNDYEKFLKLFDKNNSNRDIKLVSIYKDEFYLPFLKLINNQTIVNENIIYKIQIGIWIDIFPLDNMSNDYKKALFLHKKARRVMFLADHKRFKFNVSGNLFQKLKNIIHKLIQKLIFFVPLKYLLIKIDTISKTYMEKEMTKYIGHVNDVKVEIYESILFQSKILLDFEGHKFWAPKEYDKILTQYFGDYMKLPPENERISHKIEAYWKE